MWNLFGRYKGKKVLPSARQMNLIAAILNHVTQGTGISMQMPQQPSTDAPWVIAVDTKWLQEFIGGGGGGPELSGSTPVAPNQTSPAAGSATTAARGDHRHPISSNTLTASKWVRVDSNGNLETPTVQPVAVDQTTYPPQDDTTGITFVTAINWSGTVLRYKTRTFKFKLGILYDKGTESAWQTIDQPTVITWS